MTVSLGIFYNHAGLLGLVVCNGSTVQVDLFEPAGEYEMKGNQITNQITNQKSSYSSCLKRVIWTFSTLLALLIIGSMAEAQNKQLGIDITKCTPSADVIQKNLENWIRLQIDETKTDYRPAVAYEDKDHTGAKTDLSTKVSIRAAKMAERISKAVFAALKTSPDKAADAASNSMHGDPNRRASLHMYSKCKYEANRAPAMIAKNNIVYDDEPCSGPSESAGANLSQVHQTGLPIEAVKDGLARNLMTSGNGLAVTACTGDHKECAGGMVDAPEYYKSLGKDFKPAIGQNYFVKTSMKLGEGGRLPMTNRTVVKITEIKICGVSTYFTRAVTAGTKPSDRGFDNSTLIGLIFPVGGRTLVLGDASMQTYETVKNNIDKTPLYLPATDYFAHNIRKLAIPSLLGFYSTMATSVGSTEVKDKKIVNGLVGGSEQLEWGDHSRRPSLN